jgi:hypothetical protein
MQDEDRSTADNLKERAQVHRNSRSDANNLRIGRCVSFRYSGRKGITLNRQVPVERNLAIRISTLKMFDNCPRPKQRFNGHERAWAQT